MVMKVLNTGWLRSIRASASRISSTGEIDRARICPASSVALAIIAFSPRQVPRGRSCPVPGRPAAAGTARRGHRGNSVPAAVARVMLNPPATRSAVSVTRARRVGAQILRRWRSWRRNQPRPFARHPGARRIVQHRPRAPRSFTSISPIHCWICGRRGDRLAQCRRHTVVGVMRTRRRSAAWPMPRYTAANGRFHRVHALDLCGRRRPSPARRCAHPARTRAS